MGLLDLLDGLDDTPHRRENDIVKMPLAYPGSKAKMVDRINEVLPKTDCYVEVFGGSGAVMFNRPPSKVEVYNDRFGGITDFYRCIHEHYDELMDRLDLTIHSREEFKYCHDTWNQCDSIVERAARWYYMMVYSFSTQGRNFGRSIRSTGHVAGMLRSKLKTFPALHERLRNVQIENQSWEYCIADYDQPDAVFYLDPPYVDANPGIYKWEMTQAEHKLMLDKIHTCKGYVAISSYPNELYDSYQWDDYHQWEVRESMTSLAFTASNNKENCQHTERGTAIEALYIKESCG